jgi:hypothetical protein
MSTARPEPGKNPGMIVRLIVSWTIVLVPLAYGVFNTILKSTALF